eukprot:TRINITY_DN1855_c0_g1_i1.p1 TRINITY_DN1855_c0_g1~~TRINITY_DN1855_c0_g1_i1.p1  ORF type:complete len:581 (+),score=94.06 TRINITY_DN1855_c0_g1_i1:59-1801(+)
MCMLSMRVHEADWVVIQLRVMRALFLELCMSSLLLSYACTAASSEASNFSFGNYSNSVWGVFNNHTYFAVSAPPNATYFSSQAFASSACPAGSNCSGYTVFIDTAAENTFVFQLAAQINDDGEGPFVWLGNTGFFKDGYWRSYCGSYKHPKCLGDICCASDASSHPNCSSITTFDCSWEPEQPKQEFEWDCIIGLDKEQGGDAGRRLGEWYNTRCDTINYRNEYVYVIEYDHDPRSQIGSGTTTQAIELTAEPSQDPRTSAATALSTRLDRTATIPPVRANATTMGLCSPNTSTSTANAVSSTKDISLNGTDTSVTSTPSTDSGAGSTPEITPTGRETRRSASNSSSTSTIIIVAAVVAALLVVPVIILCRRKRKHPSTVEDNKDQMMQNPMFTATDTGTNVQSAQHVNQVPPGVYHQPSSCAAETAPVVQPAWNTVADGEYHQPSTCVPEHQMSRSDAYDQPSLCLPEPTAEARTEHATSQLARQTAAHEYQHLHASHSIGSRPATDMYSMLDDADSQSPSADYHRLSNAAGRPTSQAYAQLHQADEYPRKDESKIPSRTTDVYDQPSLCPIDPLSTQA